MDMPIHAQSIGEDQLITATMVLPKMWNVEDANCKLNVYKLNNGGMIWNNCIGWALTGNCYFVREPVCVYVFISV